jgi:hypothetical protein
VAVDLGKGDGEDRPQPPAPGLPAEVSDHVPARPASGATADDALDVAPSGLPVALVRLLGAALPALWIVMFAIGQWQIGLVLLFVTGPLMAAVGGRRSGARRRDRARRHHELHRQHGRPALRERERRRDGTGAPGGAGQRTPGAVEPAAGPSASAGPTTSAAERSLAATVVRAETSGGRVDPDAVGLIHELDELLRPLLAQVRARGADAWVRHDLEAIATEHLPAALETYLVLPGDYAHQHRAASGATPADELRSQLTLLVEGCRQLRDAFHDADLDRQQELSRFLESKFRRSDLDL